MDFDIWLWFEIRDLLKFFSRKVETCLIYSAFLFLSFFVVAIVQSVSLVQLCDPMNCSIPGFPVLYYLPEFAQTHVHWVSDAIQPSHSLSPPSPPAFNLSQHQWVDTSHQVAKGFSFSNSPFQWIFRVDFLQDLRYINPHFLFAVLVSPVFTSASST